MAYDDAGELNRRITFQKFNGRRDALGDLQYREDENWVDVLTVWASVRTISAGEFYRMEQSQSQVTHNIKIRYRTGILAEMRIRCGAQRFRILSPPIDLKGNRQWMQLKVMELVK